ncbi:ABC transporter, ATP-binding protein [Aedoeadaptatus coxii]|uniref:ABC transporter, ATP-binding protein n=1 Tax=Aedoeadaptatus coxii TaxID=755172 RepID=A0A134AH84_9FIRM|nr:ABC transporter ATP-binding protein [Peptoniphilus coxii]KXB67082.1 ABC transporter, ATP-binding protein [Peptoniphilus coxii]CAC9928746.1 ABC transporter, ATP-binding protein [Peptoniphilus coxii]
MLHIDHLSKFYGKKQVLFDISFSLDPGDICAFIGSNGAGKTTTIKSALGLIPFDSGTITIDGHNIETEPMEAKRIYSYVPDNPELYTFMRGIDYLNFIADIFELDYDTRKRGIDTLSKDFDIHNRLGEPIESYSHGMQQKLALIGALLHDPKLIVLDEPFVGLDPLATKKIREHFKRMAEDCDTTILFSTHVLEVAEKLCNKVAIIREGRLVYFGSTQEVLAKGSLEDLFVERMQDHA